MGLKVRRVKGPEFKIFVMEQSMNYRIMWFRRHFISGVVQIIRRLHYYLDQKFKKVRRFYCVTVNDLQLNSESGKYVEPIWFQLNQFYKQYLPIHRFDLIMFRNSFSLLLENILFQVQSLS